MNHGVAFIPQQNNSLTFLRYIIVILGFTFFLIDEQISKVCIHSITWSDHSPITIDIVATGASPSVNLWRNNTFLLSHPHHKAEMESKLKEFFLFNSGNSNSPAIVWCAHKAFARGVLIQLASR